MPLRSSKTDSDTQKYWPRQILFTDGVSAGEMAQDSSVVTVAAVSITFFRNVLF